jgi:predicted signal transduction protein with EAL and GGDEF domain
VGGDEFGMLLPRLGRMEEASAMAQKAMDAIKRPFVVSGREVFVTASIGISLYPRDGEDPETLLKNAFAATYVAKERGQDSYRQYTARIAMRDAHRLIVESGLRRALEQDGLVLLYQPVVDLKSGAVAALEALVAWDPPEQPRVRAADFIGVAESSGLIVAIDTWVVRAACRQARAWSDRGLRTRVAVNLSARQFQQPDLVDQITFALEQSGLPAGVLEIEITETAAMQDVDRCVETLRRLRDCGVSVAIDDFGTGYSSLNYLKRLPVDKVKLDQSFVRDITRSPDDAAIARAVVALSHSLKLSVVAEGVETTEQAMFLRQLGCDAMQGFLFSGALPAEELEALLREGRRLSVLEEAGTA